jgi:RNA polymerase sigma-70 factor (ECF subfamily)
VVEDPHQLTLLQIEAAKAGDQAALNDLLERYRGRVLQVVALRLARRRATLRGEEEDIVQETLLEAFLALERFVPRSDGAFLHWLSKLALNNIRDAGRRRTAKKRGGERAASPGAELGPVPAHSGLPGREPTPSQAACGRELAEQLESALISLPEQQRRIFVMRRLCGLSYKEIARELELGAVATARSSYARCLARLSARLPDLAPL